MARRDRLRDSAVRAVESRPARALVAAAERVDRGSPHLLVALTYHRVDDAAATPWLAPGMISASPSAFEEQVAILVRDHSPVSSGDVLAARRGGSLPRRAVLVTFDDAYADFATNAWPVLRRHGVPVTLFVPTAFPGTSRRFWWDRLWHALHWAPPDTAVDLPGGSHRLDTPASRTAAFKEIRVHVKRLRHATAMGFVDEVVEKCGAANEAVPGNVLNWDDLRALAAEGVTLAPHSRSHAMLDRLAADELTEEIAGSIDDLRAHVGAVEPVFAYPSGQHDDAVVAATKAAGIELAFTTRRGGTDLRRSDLLRLPRVNVGGRTSPTVFRLQLLPSATRLLRR